ncbi:MAG: enoyl-CoA hydratase/isomerase family protein, partial [Chloroflexi bacterium]|nr:enoyl-CoA hydratase/isomerase family protein [Chloroflexota bacterium]
SDELVHLEVAGGVATITLDSPANRNALSRALMGGLETSLDAALNDDRARLIVLTHTGPVFCSGADLKEMRGGGPPGQPGPGGLVTILKTIWRSPKPVIARIGGPTRAGGIGLIAACDLAVAVEEATFAFSEVRLGLIPAIISVVVLPKLGVTKGMELFLTGETFDATEAARLGLLNAAVPAEQLDETVDGYVASVLKGAPGALSGCKRLVREVPGMTLDDAFEQTSEWTAEYFGSEEALEGMTAFAQKRPPRWAEGK